MVTILAEGARGSLTKQLVGQLDADRFPQVYSIGVRNVKSPRDRPRAVIHTWDIPSTATPLGGASLRFDET
jgi:electron-transferring-flavoprotein dehydrogenase